ncbi:DUF7117 family protein [Natronomonas marina]|jgi:uncharacterized Zn finger protein (UPF0148 family)|uniref:DUF7117 family protein n=1 Tax=Natronomonas marina TaxID=2961939 RepID=UPI0020C9C7E7|nr:TFIIB-type zinc ribbon-containing protein [Natronomonas marina]
MKVRGQRECKECGTRWSYYDTGEAACPDCGSLYSVGVDDERSLHTATAATLDLTPVRREVDEAPLRRLASLAAERCREFTRGYGFIEAGTLQSLDDTYLAATELQHVGSELERRLEIADDEELYFTELLRADEGERPSPEAVPEGLRGMRGLAYADAVGEYRSDLRTYLREHPDDAAERVLGRVTEHAKRIRALEGDVPPREAESLVAAVRDVSRYLREGEEAALAEAEARLDGLA